MSIYYLVKKEKSLALKCLLWALVGMGVNAVVKLLFNGLGQHRPLIDLSVFGSYSPIFFSAFLSFILYDFVDWIKPVWLGWGALVTSVLYILLPLCQIKHIDDLITIPLILVYALVYTWLKKTKLRNWQRMLLAMISIPALALLLSLLTGLFYNL